MSGGHAHRQILRAAEPADHAGIDALLKAAFGGEDEARIVRALRADDCDSVELVAEEAEGAGAGRITGCVMLSPVTVSERSGAAHHGLGLAPLAVAEDRRRGGLGAALTEAALERLRPLPVPFVVVLGDPDYYARFGFTRADGRGWLYDGPGGDTPEFRAAFQVLVRDAARTPSGPARARYHPAFSGG